MHLIKSTFILSIFALLLPALSGASPAEVPRTGQTACYATAGTVIGCAGTGQDGDRLAGVAWPDPRFTVQTDDQTVTDNLTGLMWTKNANLPNRPGIWQDALNYVADMNAGTHPNFGYTDWRLPNVNELESLVNAELYNPAQPSSHPFTNMSYSYWSSTSYAYYTYNAWIVCMYYGFIYFDDKAYSSNYVWPVRSGQCGASGNSAICLPKTGQTTCHNEFGNTIDCANTGHDGELQQGVAWPDPRFAAKGNGTVPDRLTGLMWAKDANLIATRDPSFDADVTAGDGKVTWQHALDYVTKLNTEGYLGYTDWRLPNTRELHSLTDAELYNPALPSHHPFTNMSYSYYWSSASYAFYTGFAWVIGMYDGFVYFDDKEYNCYCVWPVRSGQCMPFTTTTTVGSTTTVSTTTTTVEQTTTSTSIQSATTTTTSIKPCAVKLFPASISKLGSLILPIKFFIISGEKGAELTKDTAVVWDTEGIETINTFVLGRQNKFLLVQVFIQSQFLEASELYTVKVGDCFGTLKVRAF